MSYKKDVRQLRIAIIVTEEEKEIIRKLAEEKGMSASNYSRSKLLGKI